MATIDDILNGKRTFTPNPQARDAMNAWSLNHFVPDSRLTGQTQARQSTNTGRSTGYDKGTPLVTPDNAPTARDLAKGPDVESILNRPNKERLDDPNTVNLGVSRRAALGVRDPDFRPAADGKGLYESPAASMPGAPNPAQAGESGAPKTLTELYETLKRQQDEQAAADEKKQQRDLNIKSLGDLFNSLSNLYFTTQYAPSWYSDKTSMTDKQRERYDKLNAARDANNQAWLNAYLNQADKDRAFQFQKDNADREAELKRDQFNFTVQNAQDQLEAAAKRQADQNEWQSGENEKSRNATAANNDANRSNTLEVANINAGAKGGGSGGFHQTKPVQLSNAKGGDKKNQFQIDPNIWNYAAPMLARTLAEELHYTPDAVNPKSDEEFLLENWSKSDNVTKMLHELSKTDPKNFLSVYNQPPAPPAPTEPTYTTKKGKKEDAKAKSHREKADAAEKNALGTAVTPDPSRTVEDAG